MIRLQPYVIAALVRHHRLRRPLLSSGLFEEVRDPAYAAQVAAWHESLPPAQRLSLEQLATLAAPDLLADVRILHGLDRLTRFLLLARLAANGPSFLLAAPQKDGELEIKPAASLDQVSDSVLLLLASPSDPAEPQLNVRLTHAELAALLAWIDLDARASFLARLAHQPRPESFPPLALAEYCAKEADVADPRWLLPFFAPLLHRSAIPATEPQAAAAMQGLTRRGLAQPRDAAFTFTLPGQFLSESFQRRAVLASIDTAAATPHGALGRHSVCLLRADEPLWLIDLPPDADAAVAGIRILDARTILDTLFTPLAAAPEWRTPQPSPAPAVAPPYAAAPAPVAAPPSSPARPTDAAPATPHLQSPPAPPQAPPYAAPPHRPPQAAPAAPLCRHCRQPLLPGAAFCGFCGTRQS